MVSNSSIFRYFVRWQYTVQEFFFRLRTSGCVSRHIVVVCGRGARFVPRKGLSGFGVLVFDCACVGVLFVWYVDVFCCGRRRFVVASSPRSVCSL